MTKYSTASKVMFASFTHTNVKGNGYRHSDVSMGCITDSQLTTLLDSVQPDIVENICSYEVLTRADVKGANNKTHMRRIIIN